jgi:hypothetical protein
MSMILIASAAACAPSAPATRPSPDADAPPVRALLSERDQLALSSEQVVALDSISRKLDVTGPAAGRSRGSLKRGLAARVSSAKQPDRALALVAGSHRSAMQAVEQLLRPEQRQRLCDLQREREARTALQQDERAVGGHSLASSGARRGEKRRGWPWCSSETSRPSRSAQTES